MFIWNQAEKFKAQWDHDVQGQTLMTFRFSRAQQSLLRRSCKYVV